MSVESLNEKLIKLADYSSEIFTILKQLTALVGVLQATMTMNAFIQADKDTRAEITRVMGESMHRFNYQPNTARNDLIRQFVASLNYKEKVFENS